ADVTGFVDNVGVPIQPPAVAFSTPPPLTALYDNNYPNLGSGRTFLVSNPGFPGSNIQNLTRTYCWKNPSLEMTEDAEVGFLTQVATTLDAKAGSSGGPMLLPGRWSDGPTTKLGYTGTLFASAVLTSVSQDPRS